MRRCKQINQQAETFRVPTKTKNLEGTSYEKSTRFWQELSADGLDDGAGHIGCRFLFHFRLRHLGSPAAMVE